MGQIMQTRLIAAPQFIVGQKIYLPMYPSYHGTTVQCLLVLPDTQPILKKKIGYESTLNLLLPFA
eukprot:13772467-Ditylum_brightwellii.AAC.1